MPIYEYICEECGKHFDRIVRCGIPDSEISCPVCRKNKSKRKISSFAFGVKGADGSYVAGAGSGGCSSCSSGNCSSCGHQ